MPSRFCRARFDPRRDEICAFSERFTSCTNGTHARGRIAPVRPPADPVEHTQSCAPPAQSRFQDVVLDARSCERRRPMKRKYLLRPVAHCCGGG